MAIYGHEGITEAKQIKGQEYDVLSSKASNNGEIGDSIKGEKHRATTSIGRGGVLDSVAQHHIEDIDLEKEKAITESSNILKEYIDYINGNWDKAIDQYRDNSKSQLEKRMVEDISELEKMGFDSDTIFEMVVNEYYGGKYLNLSEYLTEEDVQRANKIIKTILRMRINYVNKITTLMAKMLQTNHKILGLSEQQAKIYIDSLMSGKNDAVKSAGEIKELIKANADKFVANNGEAIDLRSLGFGVILGPSEGYELKFAGTDGTNKDGMLSLIQQAMRYDVIVVAHGGDDERSAGNIGIDVDKIVNDIREYQNREAEPLLDKIYMEVLEGLDRKRIIRYINNIDDLDVRTFVSAYSKAFRNQVIKDKNGEEATKEIHEIIFSVIAKEAKHIQEKYTDKIYSNIQQSIMIDDKYKSNEKELKKLIKVEIINKVLTNATYLIRDLDNKIESYWSCQPTKTLQSGPFEDVNELVRQLIKEGYKKILIQDCNPGGHKLAKDIMDIKGILINHSDFSNWVESSIVDTNDNDLLAINEAEMSLVEFAESYGIDYYDDEYLEEGVQWYLDNIELIQEGVFSTLKEFFKRILTGIIGIFKKIFGYIKKVFYRLKSLITGTKEEPKEQEAKFQKPIKTKMIDVKSKKVVEIISTNRADMNQQASAMCNNIAGEIKEFNRKQQSSLKKIEQDIEKLENKEKTIVKKESFIFNADEFLLEGMDLLDSVNLFMEFDAPGAEQEEEEEDEDFSMEDEGEEDEGETEETPAPAAETPETTNAEPAEASADAEDEDFSMGDEGEAETPAEETPETSEQPAEETSETQAETPEDEGEDENFDIPDDAGEEGGEGAPEEDAEDEDFSMGDEGGEAEDTDAGMEGETPVDDTSSEPEEMSETEAKLRDLESVIFDDLNEEEKKLKIKELKELYVLVYKKCGTITDMLTDIKKDEETIQIIEYISNTLIDLKQYVDDYINQVFDSKTYIENLSQLQKYIMIFNAINKVFDQIKKENDE